MFLGNREADIQFPLWGGKGSVVIVQETKLYPSSDHWKGSLCVCWCRLLRAGAAVQWWPELTWPPSPPPRHTPCRGLSHACHMLFLLPVILFSSLFSLLFHLILHDEAPSTFIKSGLIGHFILTLTNICVYFVELLCNGLNSFGRIWETLLVFQFPGVHETLSRALWRPCFLGGDVPCGLRRRGGKGALGAGVDRGDGRVLYRQPGALPAGGKDKPLVWDQILSISSRRQIIVAVCFFWTDWFCSWCLLEVKIKQ